ncbi:hypothetical protein [Humisphaera borealis]|uniref:Uncharacterized protein n=1 Tax=Humisphaera borealis TaxID=2807512 RepID=A0A7M2WZK8_9BACT|nr:hypothetical protein [Humisphaera borealis]QOV90916.1 hypothetical protein IPV69_06025 [Humisphaera borealis]
MSVVALPIVSAADAVLSLRGSFCPGCRGRKKPKQTVCFECYSKLSRPQRQNLYKRVGSGYEAAVASALQTLGVETLECK